MSSYGNISQSQIKQLNRLSKRKSSPDWIITPELARSLWDISMETGRQMGLLIDRHGTVQSVVVGEPEEITIPLLSRFKALPSKLRGLRFIRTSLNSSKIDDDDIVDLAFLRLDMISVLTGGENTLMTLHTAHLMPPNPYNAGQLIAYEMMENSDPYQNTFDCQYFIENLENEISSKTKALYEVKNKHSAILVGVFTSAHGQGEHMAELSELANSADYDVLEIVTQTRQKLHPRTVVGQGKLTEVILSALIKGADTIIFDNSVAPAQMKVLRSYSDIEIIDRTKLILDIFATRAVSNEGKIRVELARLKYFLPYLTGRDDSLSRITGGMESRGPGETKLEIDKRRITERITFLSDKLKKIERSRLTQRSKRKRRELPVVSIIGYTNAGKSTLLNTLTQSDVYADDRMFATLDTSSKRIRFPHDRDVIITDTVGFIRDLPQDLAGAFKSTLEELTDSDILLQVVDASSVYTQQHIKSVRNILKELKLDEKPLIVVFNKIDMISDEMVELLRADEPDAVFISAQDKSTLISLITRLNFELFRPNAEML